MASSSTSRTLAQANARRQFLRPTLDQWVASTPADAQNEWPKSAHRWTSFFELVQAAGLKHRDIEALRRAPASFDAVDDAILATARLAATQEAAMPAFLALFQRGIALSHSYAAQHALMVFGAYRPSWFSVPDFLQSMQADGASVRAVMGARLLQGVWGGGKLKGKPAHQQENQGRNVTPGAELQQAQEWTLALLNAGSRGLAEGLSPSTGPVNGPAANGLPSFELLCTLARSGYLDTLLTVLEWAQQAPQDVQTAHGANSVPALIKQSLRPNDILLAACAKLSGGPEQTALIVKIGRTLRGLGVSAHAALQTITASDMSPSILLFLESLGADLSQQSPLLARLTSTSTWIGQDLSPNLLGATRLLLTRGSSPDPRPSTGPRKPGTQKLKSAGSLAREAQRNGTANAVHLAILDEIGFRNAQAQRDQIAQALLDTSKDPAPATPPSTIPPSPVPSETSSPSQELRASTPPPTPLDSTLCARRKGLRI